MVRERAVREDRATALPRDPLSVGELRQLIRLMNTTDLEEITIENEAIGLRLVLRKPPAPPPPLVQHDEWELIEASDPDVLGEAPPGASAAAGDIAVRAQLVGVFHASAQSDGQGAVAVGEFVREGQVLGAIQALNVLNEIETPAVGRVKEIVVTDGQAVEYGQLLLVLATSDA